LRRLAVITSNFFAIVLSPVLCLPLRHRYFRCFPGLFSFQPAARPMRRTETAF
jgi:hypothetical protein